MIETWRRRTFLKITDIPFAEIIRISRCTLAFSAQQDFAPFYVGFAFNTSSSGANHTRFGCELPYPVEISVWDGFASTQAADCLFQQSYPRGVISSLLLRVLAVPEQVRAYRGDGETVNQVRNVSRGHGEPRTRRRELSLPGVASSVC